ncbi:MAG: divergent polysaccharide deacetylase family protein [Alphaproteobacteria bacterium]|nr:divergent polysaccharide deacetylase family protein [Alphaproteobacteria bacterium]
MSKSPPDYLDLPPRRESFLARYPRKVKLAGAAVLLVVLIAPPVWIHMRLHRSAQNVEAASYAPQSKTEENPEAAGVKSGVEADAAAFYDPSVKLTPAPDSRVTEDTGNGSLPRISDSGLRPWQVYARPFNAADKRPRIAIVVTGLGMAKMITDQAITQLPPPVTLSFNAQAPAVAALGTRARQNGHEILLQVPMEPFDYPQNDPGPGTLLTNLSNSDNVARLLKVLSKAVGYVGITSTHGASFTANQEKFAPVMQVLHDRGLMVLDTHDAPYSVVADMARSDGVPVATTTERLDADLSPDVIAATLGDLEKTARQTGHAVGITAATPVMVAQLQTWIKGLPERGIALAPLSATVQ